MMRKFCSPHPLRRAAMTAVIAMLMVTACRPSTSESADPFVVADLFATPGKAIATIQLTPTPPPTATVPNVLTPTPAPTLPLPTAVVLRPTQPIADLAPSPTPESALPPATVTPPCGAPPLPFGPSWQNVEGIGDALGCPTGNPRRIYGVFQYYEHGVMFWREEDGSIFVISNRAIEQGQDSDKWWRLSDTYQEGEPAPEDIEPPEGLVKPVRGFGKVWKNNAFVREALGWATGEEIGYETFWLDFESGWMMTAPGDSPVYVLIPLDDPPYSNGLNLGYYP